MDECTVSLDNSLDIHGKSGTDYLAFNQRELELT
jgi:hypothetical protein